MYSKLIQWSNDKYSHLPWRVERTLYRTLVSEIMLQQTTVQTVLNHYEKFLKVYPNIESLAEASDDEVAIQWKGLGYYRRARNLRNACRFIVERYAGKIPLEYKKLIEISGIGDYTANALLAIGADKKALALDGNLMRVLSRLYCVEGERGPQLIKNLQRAFADGSILSSSGKSSFRALNEAFMDLGRVICRSKKPHCQLCPINGECLSFKRQVVEKFPYPNSKKASQSHELHLLRLVVERGKKLVAYQKAESEWLSGQWELPTFVLKTDDPTFKQYPSLKAVKLSKLKSFKSLITKYKITNYVMPISYQDFKSNWESLIPHSQLIPYNLKEQNFATSTLKALRLIGTR